MADHVFPTGNGKCLVCGVPKNDAHRVACTDPNPPIRVEGEKAPMHAGRKPRK